MFIPAGYWHVQEAVWFVARKGEAGSLPSRFGFSMPEAEPDPLDIDADANARIVLGELLAAGSITAEMILPGGMRLPVPAWFWSGPEAHQPLLGQAVSVAAFVHGGMPEKVLRIIVKQADVLAALGIRFVDEENRPSNDDTQSRFSPNSEPLLATSLSLASATDRPELPARKKQQPRGLNYNASDTPLVAEMDRLIRERAAKNGWDAALIVSPKAEGAGAPMSIAKRLLAKYRKWKSVQSRSEAERD